MLKFLKKLMFNALGFEKTLKHTVEMKINRKIEKISEKLICDVDDLKSDYLKRYLESRMNNNQLFIEHLSTKIDLIESKTNELQARLESIEYLEED